MNTTDILKKCGVRNITLKVVDDQLYYRAPKGALNDKLKKQLRDYKPQLIKTLSAELSPDYYDRHIGTVIAEFNSRGLRMIDVAEINRRKADKFDKEMTESANRGDREEFQKALNHWRECFH